MPLLDDFRHAMRSLTRAPASALLVVLLLALGFGGSTAMFSVVRATLLQPLPYDDSEQLVWVWSFDSNRGIQQWVSYPDLLDWRARSQTFQRLAGWGGYEAILTGAGDPARLRAALAMEELFDVLGVPPLIGSLDAIGGDLAPVRPVLLSHGLWQRRFDGDPAIAGRGVSLNGETHTVVGVMPRDFQFPIGAEAVDVWVLLREGEFNPVLRDRRDARLIEVVGRLKSEATVEQAQAEMTAVAATLSELYPSTNRDITARVVPARTEALGATARAIWPIGAAVGCLLLIGCVNVAGLLLARATARRQELAIRMALGASRPRIGMQLLVEGIPLAVAGAVAGACLAAAALRLLVPWLPADLPRAADIAMDVPVLGFTLLVSLATALGFGLAPAWYGSSVEPASRIRAGDLSATEPRSVGRVLSGLVVAQVAIALVLTIGAALLAGSFWRLTREDSSFSPRNVLTFAISWPSPAYSRAQAADAFAELRTRLLGIPGVQAASTGLQLPDRGRPAVDAVLPALEVEGRPLSPGERLLAPVMGVQPGYFPALGIPLIAGREFADTDRTGSPLVTIVNESLARAYFPNEDPIGKRLITDSWAFLGERTREIVGVVRDVTHRGLTEATPMTYVPLAQYPRNSSPVVVRTHGDPLGLVGAVREAVRAIDPEQPIDDIQTLEQRMASSLSQDRFATLLLVLFAATALLLAAGGLYGVLSFVIARGTRDMGIRLALGADHRSIISLVLRRGMALAIGGCAIGVPVALALTQFIATLVFGVSTTDPITFVGSISLLLLVALAACWIPARRAAKADPVSALRGD